MIYDLYAESGPRHRKTYIHVPQLLGCVARGSTTEEAVAAAPEEIRRFLRFLKRHGETVDPDVDVDVRVAEHFTEGISLGEGFPYLTLPTDYEPIDETEIDRQLERVRWILDEVGEWASAQDQAVLEIKPAEGRSAWNILLHILGPLGSYLASAFGRAPGFGPIKSAAEKREIPIQEAFQLSWERCAQRVKEATPEEWNRVRPMSGYDYTLRKALRRMTEHSWEHFVELSHRQAGPVL